MTALQSYELIDTEDIKVSIPTNSHFSIGTSPYYAHSNALAIDIYHEISLDNYEALSPIAGKVIETKKLIAPKPKFSGGTKKEYLILIQSINDPNTVFKVLHINPEIKKGQVVDVGDVLGSTIRNGYFAPWSSPHIHLELRPKEDMIRASGGKAFILNFNQAAPIGEEKDKTLTDKIPVIIDSIFPEFFLVKFSEEFYYKIDPFFGIKGINLNTNCIIDGGIPLYKKGAVIFHQGFKSEYLSSLLLNGQKIGTLWNQRGNFGLINFDKINFSLDDKEIRGISLFLANFKPLIKIIPYDMKDHPYELKSNHSLTFSSVL